MATPTSVTVGTAGLSGDFRTFSDITAIAADTGSVSFEVSGKRANGTAFSGITKIQTFQKSKAGQDAWACELDSSAFQVSKLPDGTNLPFSKRINISVLKGAADKNSEYTITNIAVFSEANVSLPLSTIGLGSTTSSNMYLDVSTLLADYARVDITVGGAGPSFTKSFLFSKIEAGSQGPGILYIGEFSTLLDTRVLNNNGISRDVVSLNGDYYAYIGVDGDSVSAIIQPEDLGWEAD